MSMISFVVAVAFLLNVCNGFQTPYITGSGYTTHKMSMIADQDPLLLRAARGEVVEAVPVWMMRQAGRHIKVNKLYHHRNAYSISCIDVSIKIVYCMVLLLCIYLFCYLFILCYFMKEYKELCKVHKTFRERSETADIATEIRYVLLPKNSFISDRLLFVAFETVAIIVVHLCQNMYTNTTKRINSVINPSLYFY